MHLVVAKYQSANVLSVFQCLLKLAIAIKVCHSNKSLSMFCLSSLQWLNNMFVNVLPVLHEAGKGKKKPKFVNAMPV